MLHLNLNISEVQSMLTEDEKRKKHADYMREYNRRNAEKLNARRKELRNLSEDSIQKNRDKVKAWREKDPERAKRLKRESYDRNKVLVGRKSGSDHHNWSEECTYGNAHEWIRRVKGRPKKCELCGTTDESIRYEWANVDHAYSRNPDDYIRMCPPCHRKYDIEFNGALYGRRNNRRQKADDDSFHA